MMYEVRIHGRGGQGAVLAGRLLGEAAMNSGYYAQSFPEFGAERSGAPVTAYTRIADEPIETRSPIKHPNAVLSIDRFLSLDKQITAGLRDGGLVVVNSTLPPQRIRSALGLKDNVKLAVLDATKIALEVLGRNNPNTAVLGAFAAVSRIVPAESLAEAVRKWFPGRVGEANAEAVYRGSREVVLG